MIEIQLRTGIISQNHLSIDSIDHCIRSKQMVIFVVIIVLFNIVNWTKFVFHSGASLRWIFQIDDAHIERRGWRPIGTSSAQIIEGDEFALAHTLADARPGGHGHGFIQHLVAHGHDGRQSFVDSIARTQLELPLGSLLQVPGLSMKRERMLMRPRQSRTQEKWKKKADNLNGWEYKNIEFTTRNQSSLLDSLITWRQTNTECWESMQNIRCSNQTRTSTTHGTQNIGLSNHRLVKHKITIIWHSKAKKKWLKLSAIWVWFIHVPRSHNWCILIFSSSVFSLFKLSSLLTWWSSDDVALDFKLDPRLSNMTRTDRRRDSLSVTSDSCGWSDSSINSTSSAT